MPLVVLFAAVLLALTGWIGAARTAARSLVPLFAAVTGLLLMALLNWAISAGTGGRGFASGVVGAVAGLVMLTLATGLMLGALGRWLYERLRGAPPVRPAPLAPAWDMIGLTVLAVAGLVLSLFE